MFGQGHPDGRLFARRAESTDTIEARSYLRMRLNRNCEVDILRDDEGRRGAGLEPVRDLRSGDEHARDLEDRLDRAERGDEAVAEAHLPSIVATMDALYSA